MATGRWRMAPLTMVVLGAAGCSLVEAGIIGSASSGSRADASTDAGDAGDADAHDASPVDSWVCAAPVDGSPCDPGFIDCPNAAGMRCQVEPAPGLLCCLQGFTYSCVLPDASPITNCPNGTRACDEASDCPAGEQCWGMANTGGDHYETVCSNGQPPGMYFQLCKSDSECQASKCTVQQCSGIALMGQIETCGPIGMPSCM